MSVKDLTNDELMAALGGGVGSLSDDELLSAIGEQPESTYKLPDVPADMFREGMSTEEQVRLLQGMDKYTPPEIGQGQPADVTRQTMFQYPDEMESFGRGVVRGAIDPLGLSRPTTVSEKAYPNTAIGGEFVGSVAPYEGVFGVANKILGKAVGVGSRMLRGASIGTTLGAARATAQAAAGQGFDPSQAPEEGLLFAGLEGVLGGIGMAGGKVIRLVREKRYAEAKRLFSEATKDKPRTYTDDEVNQVLNAIDRAYGDSKPLELPAPEGTGKEFTSRPSEPKGVLDKPMTAEDWRVWLAGEQVPSVSRPTFIQARSKATAKPTTPIASVKDAGTVSKPSPVSVDKPPVTMGEGKTLGDLAKKRGHNAMGIVAGVQTETDENGMPTGVSFDPTMAAIGLGVGMAATRGWGGKITPKFLQRNKARMTHPESKSLLAGVEKTQVAAANMLGKWDERLNVFGLSRMSHADATRFAERLESGDRGEVGALLDEVQQKAASVGVPIGHLRNYFPRMMKRDIAQKIYDDLESVLEGAGESFSDDALRDALRRRSMATNQAISSLMENNQLTYRQAVDALRQHTASQLFSEVPFARHRTLTLPASMYDRDARHVLPRYLDLMSKRIALAEQFGGNLEGAARSIDNAKITNPKEGALVEDVFQQFTGQYERANALGTTAGKAINAISSTEYGVKIGAGESVIPNITQPLISIVEKYGALRFLKGTLSLLDPASRSSVRQSGAINQDVQLAISGYHPGGVWGKFADLVTTPFRGINKLNQYMSAATGLTALEDYYRLANGAGFRSEWAKKKLSEMGVDHTAPLTDEIRAQVMFRTARDSQLQKNILEETKGMNDPKYRMLWMFKRFGYKQFNFQKDLLKTELSQGNVLPLVRLLAGGIVGGEGVIFAKNWVRETLSGKPHYRKDDFDDWERYVDDLAAVGSLGMFSDVAGGITGDNPATSTLGKVGFAATPALAQDVLRAGDIAMRASRKFDATGDVGQALSSALPAAEKMFLGTLPSKALERTQTVQQSNDELVENWTREKAAILDLMANGNIEDGLDRWILWNEHYPNAPISYEKISPEVVRKKVESDAKKKLDLPIGHPWHDFTNKRKKRRR